MRRLGGMLALSGIAVMLAAASAGDAGAAFGAVALGGVSGLVLLAAGVGIYNRHTKGEQNNDTY